ncbi:MAG TPA: GNAT family N-acetyltransferase [Thermoanaerobaculaceae bacterium]|nr:GNAT family N-acetyltransferase [Thermoanaerobaculaceae bacterium]HRS17312.1 GNAT family N-acetyltransferase [Thermoanaerobaculaceae bacterium]
MKLRTPVGRPDTVPIGNGAPADLKALVELDRLCFGMRAWPARAWWEVLNEPGWGLRVVRGGGTVVGATVLLIATPVSSLASVAVHPAWRRRGLGTALLEDAIALARRAGSRWLSLAVDRDHAAARRLYRQRGFVAAMRMSEDGIPRLEMLRRL